MRHRLYATVLSLLVLGGTACSSDDGSSRVPTSATTSASATPAGAGIQFEELGANHLKWSNAAITNYRYKVSILTTFNAFGRDPVIMTVHGTSVSMTHSDGTPLTRTENGYEEFRRYSTIDRNFGALSWDLTTAYKVTVAYDPIYGYPTHFAMDEGFNQTDDETSVLISEFEVLE